MSNHTRFSQSYEGWKLKRINDAEAELSSFSQSYEGWKRGIAEYVTRKMGVFLNPMRDGNIFVTRKTQNSSHSFSQSY